MTTLPALNPQSFYCECGITAADTPHSCTFRVKPDKDGGPHALDRGARALYFSLIVAVGVCVALFQWAVAR